MTSDAQIEGWRSWHDETEPIRLGVSSCLLGEMVRFDGGHQRDRFVTDVLGPWVQWVPVCPEVEVGMPTPRPAIHIEEDERGEQLVAPSTGENFTEVMTAFSKRRVGELEAEGLDGYVLKKNSPSCGLSRISVYKNGKRAHRGGVGLFAASLIANSPLLPIEEEGRLNDPGLRESFIEQILCRNRWRLAVKRGLTRKRLIDFHTAHKLILFSHNESASRRLGRLVGEMSKTPDEALFARYELDFHMCLRSKMTRKRHTNVLQHAMGHLKQFLDSKAKQEILATIADFRQALLPLIVPLTLLKFNMNQYSVDYLRGQLYFDPHPKELMLRNHC